MRSRSGLSAPPHLCRIRLTVPAGAAHGGSNAASGVIGDGGKVRSGASASALCTRAMFRQAGRTRGVGRLLSGRAESSVVPGCCNPGRGILAETALLGT
jgi:hypothetical protein